MRVGKHGGFYGDVTFQGILPYYYEDVAPPGAHNVAELDRCVFNQMGDNPRKSTHKFPRATPLDTRKMVRRNPSVATLPARPGVARSPSRPSPCRHTGLPRHAGVPQRAEGLRRHGLPAHAAGGLRHHALHVLQEAVGLLGGESRDGRRPDVPGAPA